MGDEEGQDPDADVKQSVETREEDEKEEGFVVLVPDTSVQPLAVVVKPLNALVTGSTVF